VTGPADDAILGCLLGGAVGDAVGLCAEGLSPRRLGRLFPNLDGPRLLGRRGFVSDDTEHACLTAQALITSVGEPARFARALAWRLRWWLAGAPAGIGRATLRAGLKLWLGWPPHRSGVFSAGNGPAMRAALLGVCFGHDPARLRELVHSSTHLTHTDPRAEHGALAVAGAAWLASRPEPLSADVFRAWFGENVAPCDDGLRQNIEKALSSAERGEDTAEFARSMGWAKAGVTGFINHTVPAVLQAALRHPDDLRAAVLAVVRCGGDADTTGAIVGGVVGARVGRAGVPADWLARLCEWPRTVGWMEKLGRRLGEVLRTGQPSQRLPVNPAALLVRNGVFLAIVLAHGFRRLAPPY
jgi:ADP-ribosyl-[dinitrogen reductase] hydrolase